MRRNRSPDRSPADGFAVPTRRLLPGRRSTGRGPSSWFWCWCADSNRGPT